MARSLVNGFIPKLRQTLPRIPWSLLRTVLGPSSRRRIVVCPAGPDTYLITILKALPKDRYVVEGVRNVSTITSRTETESDCEHFTTSVDDDIVLVIPRDQTIVRYVLLPTEDRDQINRMAPYEAYAASPWQPDESLVGFEVQKIPEKNHTWVAIYAVHLAAVQDHLNALSRVGLSPTHVLPSVSCIAAILAARDGGENPSVLFRCTFGMEFVRVAEGRHVVTRGMLDDVPLSTSLHRVLEPDNRRTASDDEALRIYHLGLSDSEIASIQQDIPRVEFRLLETSDATNPSGAAIALGASRLLEQQPGINLVPAARKSQVETRRTLKRVVILVLMLTWSCGVSVALGYGLYRDQLARTERAEAEIAQLGPGTRALREKHEALRALQNERMEVTRPLAVVLDLYDKTPQQIAINSMRYDSPGTLVLGGESPSFSHVFSYMESLRTSKLFYDIRLTGVVRPRGSGNSLVEFKIACRLKRPDLDEEATTDAAA